MKNNNRAISSFVLGLLLAVGTPVAAATVYTAGSLLQTGDVHSSHILDGTILNVDINSAAGIGLEKLDVGPTHNNVFFDNYGTFATSTALTFATSTPKLTVTGQLAVTASTTLNGVEYNWPSADGTSGYSLSTNGAGKLSWTNGAASYIVTAINSGTTTTVTSPKAVYMNPTGFYNTTISYEGGNKNDCTGSCTASNTVNYTVTAANNTTVYLTCLTNGGTSGRSGATMDGSAMQQWLDEGSANPGGTVYIATSTTAVAHTFVCNFSGIPTQSSAIVEAYEGTAANQATAATITAATNSTSLTTTVAGSWIGVAASSNGGTCSLADGTNAIIRHSLATSNANGVLDSNAQFNTPGAQTVSYGSSCTTKNIGAYEILPYTTATLHYGFNYTDASAAGTANTFIGFITTSPTKDASTDVYTQGVLGGFSGLTIGSIYYLTNSLGAIGTSAGTVSHKVGVSVSTTELLIMQQP